MDFDDLEPSTRLTRGLLQASLFLATALIAGVGFAYLADSGDSSGGVRMQAVTEVPYTAHLDVAPRADRLPKSQQAAPVTPLQEGEDAAFAQLVDRALAETEAAKAPAIAPTDDFGAVAEVIPPIPVARPEPPAPAVAQYDDPFEDRPGMLVPMEPIPQHQYAGDGNDGYQAQRPKGRPLDAFGLPFEIVGQTVTSIGDAVASIARPARRY